MSSAPPSSAPRTWTASVSRRVLDNGLTALVQSDPDAPAVAVVIHVRAGFFDEPDRWQGISHVLEHMFFKGTPTRGVGRIAAETKALGGYLNAATAYDWTSYYVVLPATGFREALAIQADAVRNVLIDPDELGRELRVIVEEAKRKLDSPSAVTGETLHELLFDRHRIRRWRIGTEPVLSGFRRDDVFGYYRSRYVPSRVVVSVVGAVDPEETFQAIDAEFGDWAAREADLDQGPEEPWRRGVRARTLRGDVRQADLSIGWRGAAHLDADAVPLDLAALVLSSGRGSWLYRSLRQPGLVTSAAAYHYSPSEVGVFSIGVDLKPEQIEPVLTVIAGLMARLREEGPSAEDLVRAKTLLASQMARRFESVDSRASSFALAEASGGVELVDEEYEALMATTADRVRAVAARYLTPDTVAAVTYLPHDRGSDLTAETLRRIFVSARAVAPEPFSNDIPLPATAPKRARPGEVTAGVTHVALPGVDLLIRPKRSVPLVTVGIYRRRQTAESPERAGLGSLALRSAARGTVDLDARQLAHQLERLGGTLGTSVAADWYGVGASVLAADYDRAAALLLDVLTRPRFDPAEIGRERELLLDEAIQTHDDMLRRPIDLALGAAFGDRGYGVPVKGVPESIRGLSPDDVAGWHRGELGSGRTLVVAVGHLDPEEAAERLAGVFGDLPARNGAEPAPGGGRFVGAAPARIEARAKSQSGLAMIFPGPSRRDPDRHAAEVLAAVASGLGGRLFHALRDQRSLAYTVLFSSWQRLGAGALLGYIATSPAREEEARAAMLAELATFAAEPVAEDEWRRAVSYLAGQALVQRQTSAALASEIVDAWLIGGGLAELADPAAPYRKVTIDQIRAVAARCLDPDSRVEGVVRGEGTG